MFFSSSFRFGFLWRSFFFPSNTNLSSQLQHEARGPREVERAPRSKGERFGQASSPDLKELPVEIMLFGVHVR